LGPPYNDHLQYDAEQRPITLTHLEGGVPITISLGYNADGLRARYTVVMSGTAIDDERFQYRDGELAQVSAITATLNSNGPIKSQGVPYTDTYIYGPIGEPLEFLRQQGGVTSRYWYALDGQGSVVAVTDITGKVVDRYNYDSWGEQIGRYHETVPQQLRYRGYWYDSEVEWYWLDGRYYDPEDLHWLQPDPSQQDGAHTYVYANDDPVDLIEVGGAFSISGFFHHAVQFLDSATHVTFKVAEAAWNAVAGDDVHVICCTSYPVPIKALAALDLAITVVPGADVTKLLEVGVKGAAKAGGEQAAFALVRWIAGKTDSKVAADLSDNVLRDAFRARKTGGSGALRDAEKVAGCALCFPTGTLVATPHGEQAIESLHVGDLVQAEDPATGKVEAEAVQAVIRAIDADSAQGYTHPYGRSSWGSRALGPGCWPVHGRARRGTAATTGVGRGRARRWHQR